MSSPGDLPGTTSPSLADLQLLREDIRENAALQRTEAAGHSAQLGEIHALLKSLVPGGGAVPGGGDLNDSGVGGLPSAAPPTTFPAVGAGDRTEATVCNLLTLDIEGG
jgi:hypothetical protein